jgi:TRAP-type C4-dicarboxylate transport system permease small subunit
MSAAARAAAHPQQDIAMKRLENIAAAIFGTAFLMLALLVALETVMRKAFNTSLQGVDELGGYLLASSAALAMAVALVSRAHIRIDLLHDFAPRSLRNLLNVTAMLALFASAVMLLRMAWIALDESILFNATAQTPWATPLRHPQTAWVAAIAIFVAVAFFQLLRAGYLAFRGQWAHLDKIYGPRGAKEELDEELEDLRLRSQGAAQDHSLSGKAP